MRTIYDYNQEVSKMKLTNINPLAKWKNVHFNSSPTRTVQFANFDKCYTNWFRRLCKNNGWTLSRVVHLHFEISIYIKGTNGRYVNVLGSDVRMGGWFDNVYYRYCADEKDCHGEHSWRTTIPELEESLRYLLND